MLGPGGPDDAGRACLRRAGQPQVRPARWGADAAARRGVPTPQEELAALVVGVNPTVQFEETQITAILDEVFEAYASFI